MTLENFLMPIQWLGECKDKRIDLFSFLGINPNDYFKTGLVNYDEQERLIQDVRKKHDEITARINQEKDLPLKLKQLGQTLCVDVTKAKGLLVNPQLYTNPNPQQSSISGSYVEPRDYTLAMQNMQATPHTLSYILEVYLQAIEAIQQIREERKNFVSVSREQHGRELQLLRTQIQDDRVRYELEKGKLIEAKSRDVADVKRKIVELQERILDLQAEQRVELAGERKSREILEQEYKNRLAEIERKYELLKTESQGKKIGLESNSRAWRVLYTEDKDLSKIVQEELADKEREYQQKIADYEAKIKLLEEDVANKVVIENKIILNNLLEKTKEVDSLKKSKVELDQKYTRLTAELEAKTRELDETKGTFEEAKQRMASLQNKLEEATKKSDDIGLRVEYGNAIQMVYLLFESKEEPIISAAAAIAKKLRDEKKISESIIIYEKLTEVDPNNHNHHYFLATTYEQVNRGSERTVFVSRKGFFS
ncbi:hypothetical protein HYX11_01420 [Candidatus Woesearchaeota archaeon]|nr:hypothetical protein [Candidatus Woesearchaeota archaeon]